MTDATRLSRVLAPLDGKLPDLEASGYEVHTGLGRTGVLRNGTGPTVMLRADIDALPVEEKTGLTLSTVRAPDADGGEVPVMQRAGTTCTRPGSPVPSTCSPRAVPGGRAPCSWCSSRAKRSAMGRGA